MRAEWLQHFVDRLRGDDDQGIVGQVPVGDEALDAVVRTDSLERTDGGRGHPRNQLDVRLAGPHAQHAAGATGAQETVAAEHGERSIGAEFGFQIEVRECALIQRQRDHAGE